MKDDLLCCYTIPIFKKNWLVFLIFYQEIYQGKKIMSKPLLQSYIAGVRDTSHGESYYTIISYFLPEFVTALVLYSILNLIDASFIAQLESTSTYATQGVTNTLMHFITKLTESISVGAVVLCGHYNGMASYRNVGRSAISALWVTIFLGGFIASVMYFGAHTILSFYNVPEKMVVMGASFLRIRALGVFFAFMYFALVGFLRGIKNTKVPMFLFLLGGTAFIFFDYVLIFGKLGFPALKLQGSACAAVIQYMVMFLGAFLYIIFNKESRNYSIDLFQSFDLAYAREIIILSWPVMIDKATLALAQIWLSMLISPLGKIAIASFTVIKDMERLAFVPAIAFGQVITFLVSNDYSTKNWVGIKNNIKKVLLLASVMVFSILFLFCLSPATIIQCFDKKGVFTAFASYAFPFLSVLVFCDLLQLILSGALRGAADVKTVMWVRLGVCTLFFLPISYSIYLLPIANPLIKFMIIYGSFYIGNGLMSIIYIVRFRGDAWKHHLTTQEIKAVDDENYTPRSNKISTNIADKNPGA